LRGSRCPRRSRPSPLTLAAAAGLAVEFLLIAATRSGGPYAIHPRYTYTAAAFGLIIAAELIAIARWPLLRVVIGVVLAGAIVSNAVSLLVGPGLWGAGRYQLPTAFGCIPVASITDPDGLVQTIPPGGRC
jgi:hypothetical protein